jgi:hypothetical protein
MFIGRKQELNILETHYHSKISEFCILYGRRRIGKSTLLEEFTKNKFAFFYLAGKENKRLQLKRFVRELGQQISDPFIEKMNVTQWNDALLLLDKNIDLLAQNNKLLKAVVIFDEFQWMCNGAIELLSDLQRFWDKGWKNSGQVFLIICGSSISFMLGEVLSQKSPLFGRRTLSFELKSFDIAEAALFLPEKNTFEIAETYMTIGGIPKYLEIINATGDSFRKRMSQEAFSSSGYFYDEIHFILSEQLKETENYFLLLEHMASGASEIKELVKLTNIPSGQIIYYLERLIFLGFVSRYIPINAPKKSKKVKYLLEDYYLKFYFNFIHQNLQRFSMNNEMYLFDQITKNRWDVYLGTLFEQFVRDHATIIAKKFGYTNEIQKIGSYWQHPTKRKKGVQIDLVIEFIDHTTFICECKWKGKSKTGMEAVSELRQKAKLYPNKNNHTLKCVLIASGGVTQPVLKQKDIHIVTLDDFVEKTC